MSHPVSTVLVTGCGDGIGPELTDLWLARGALVVATTRPATIVKRPRPGVPPAPRERLHLMAIDVARDTSLHQLAQALRALPPLDVIVHLASMRQLVSLDRLNLTTRPVPFAFQLLAALRVTYAVFDRLAPGARVLCVATPPPAAREFGSLGRPPRVSPGGVHLALSALATELEGRRGRLALLYPGLQGLPAPWVMQIADQLPTAAPGGAPLCFYA